LSSVGQFWGGHLLYPNAFKEEAVALITQQGYTVAKAEESLGVAINMLSRWIENAEKQKAG